MYNNIAEIKQANEKAGRYFFSEDTMRFFNSEVYDEIYGGKYFITCESPPFGGTKYTVRKCDTKGHINTVSDFQQFGTEQIAIDWIKNYILIKSQEK